MNDIELYGDNQDVFLSAKDTKLFEEVDDTIEAAQSNKDVSIIS